MRPPPFRGMDRPISAQARVSADIRIANAVAELAAPEPSAALALLRDERARQVREEGHSPAHDGKHDAGEIMYAAMCYLNVARDNPAPLNPDGAPMGWPWSAEWWKPKGKLRDLVRAGALMLAERERLLRANPASHVGHVDHKLAIVLELLPAVLAEEAAP